VLESTEQQFRSALLEALDPEELGLSFRPIKYDGLQAASGTTDFAGLFFGFSFFLILSATILIGLLFRLGIERRAGQVGLLSAVGLTQTQVRRQLLAEGAIVVVLGGLLGVAAAIGYASVMVYGLKTWWIGAVGTRFLDVYLEPPSLIYGFAIAVGIALAAIWWGMRQLKRVSTRDLLQGTAHPVLTVAEQRRRGRIARGVALIGGGLAGVLLIAALSGLVPATEAFMGIAWPAVVFFTVGICLLAASLALLAVWLDSDRSAAVRGSGWAGTGRLGMRNAARNRTRSVLTTGLIASATFVIVAVAAAHRDPAAEAPRMDSGNGGFLLVAETTTPILADLNSEIGREKLNLAFDPKSANAEERRNAELVRAMQVIPFRVKPGENASCLNLYKTQLPTILGVSERMIDRGGFKFVGAKEPNPWTLLRGRSERDGVPVYPVLGDMNSLQYSLKKGVGDVIAVPDDAHPEYLLQIAGMFDGSIFQGVLLMSEENFLRLYPEHVGYEYFLIEAPPASERELSNLLETRLNDYGFDAEPVAERLANFLAVQNTYLSTFQTLGGLGLLLGTLGLATVMLRNVLERRGELALLRAVGFRNSRLSLLVLCENAFLLAWGLLAGTASALLAMTPHLASTGADIPWTAGALTLLAVLLIGMAAALLAVLEAVRTPIVATLRAE
jgi:ABC-type antimicrobial peptide transport system permease subunit